MIISYAIHPIAILGSTPTIAITRPAPNRPLLDEMMSNLLIRQS